MPTAIRNRRGRKRKSGQRKPSGDIVTVRTDYREMAALTPHRIGVAAAYRTDFRAESVLGRLNIVWRTSGLTCANRPGISDDEYEAGIKYARIVQAYLRLANAPRLAQMRPLARSGIDPDTPPVVLMMRDAIDGEAITKRYMDAYEAISDAAGRQGHMEVNSVVVHDQPRPGYRLPHLRVALRALADHFGLTNHRKR